MEAWLKILVGLALLFVSLGYLYRPVWILKMNVLGRTLLFNDTHVLLYRRRWGIPLFAAAALFLYTGLGNLSQQRPSSSIEVWMAHRSFLARHYRQTIVQCEGILAKDPENQQAWSLLGSAWSAMGDRDKAAKAWNRSLALGQTDPEGRPTGKRDP